MEIFLIFYYSIGCKIVELSLLSASYSSSKSKKPNSSELFNDAIQVPQSEPETPMKSGEDIRLIVLEQKRHRIRKSLQQVEMKNHEESTKKVRTVANREHLRANDEQSKRRKLMELVDRSKKRKKTEQRRQIQIIDTLMPMLDRFKIPKISKSSATTVQAGTCTTFG